MTTEPQGKRGSLDTRRRSAPPGDDCVMVIFGAAGDLTKRLLVPALYNLACDGLLPERFAVVGTALDDLTTDSFRERLADALAEFTTRKSVQSGIAADLVERFHYLPGRFEDPELYRRVGKRVAELDESLQTGGNVLFYLATPPAVFGLVGQGLAGAGLHESERGWRRLVVEKPFGHDLESARALNAALLRSWREEQIFRIDHYLGKETVQNLLAFRFSSGLFEALWSKSQIDHIQFTVSESVGVEGRGAYYERAGVLRDMIQNHMFQMLAYLCMEPPSSFRPDAIRNEKAKVLEAVRIMSSEEVLRDTVRGQYGPGRKPDGTPVPGYRQEPGVDPASPIETYAALKLHIDNWRWDGVPVYLRSGKSLWKRGTEIVVQFRKAPEVLFRDVPDFGGLDSDQLVFHMQPDQGIELRFQAKSPGPSMGLQKVSMRFEYEESFEATRGTGYEVLLYHCLRGDATLFTRNDLVEAAWQIAQPILDTWKDNPCGNFPNYEAGSWGPKDAFDLLEADSRRWLEVINRAVLEKVPLFHGASAVFLRGLAMVLKPDVFAAGDAIVRKGETGSEMYVLARGEVDVMDGDRVLSTLSEGSFFGERSLFLSEPRNASVVAKSHCDVFILEKADLARVLKDHPRFARSMLEACRSRYQLTAHDEQAFSALLTAHLDRQS